MLVSVFGCPILQSNNFFILQIQIGRIFKVCTTTRLLNTFTKSKAQRSDWMKNTARECETIQKCFLKHLTRNAQYSMF